MRFSSFLLAGAALVAGVIAQQKVEFTNSVFGTLLAGQPFTITWADATGPVTITLKNGVTNDLQTVSTVATGLSGTSFVWTPPKSLASGAYALEITDGKTTNYSPQFVLGGGSASAAPTTTGTKTATASGSSTASGSATASKSASSASASASASGSSSAASQTTLSKSASSSSASSTASKSSSSSSASKTSSSTASHTSAAPSTTTTPPNANTASGLASPLAFVLLAVAALVTLN